MSHPGHYIIAILSITFLNLTSYAQNKIDISTVDIVNFWEAYDSLRFAKDSVETIQQLYIDRASPGLREFVRSRNLKSAEYLRLIKRYPAFWSSIRSATSAVRAREKEMEAVFQKFENSFPGFRSPQLCFAIGCLTTGGTTSRQRVLLGTEVVSVDIHTDTKGMSSALRSFLGSKSDMVSMIAHEIVHTQQATSLAYLRQYMSHRLLTQCIREGAADFVSMKVAGTTIHELQFAYGETHFAALVGEFLKSEKKNDLSKWLYNGTQRATDRPADLGYFIGYKICEYYYQGATDKAKALSDILRTRNPKRIYKKSGFRKAMHRLSASKKLNVT
jgi:hypothetical protein